MGKISIRNLFKNKITGNIIILAVSILLIYFLVSIYFASHFCFNTVINGVDVSLKAHGAAGDIIKNYVKDYKLKIVERDGEAEEITAQDIGMQFNENNSMAKTYQRKNSFKWIISLFKKQNFYVDDLYSYDKDILDSKVNQLKCVNKPQVEPQNVSFKYSNGSFETIGETYGNKIIMDRLDEAVENNISRGDTKLDLNEKLCYENPKYTLASKKTSETRSLLNTCVNAKITYKFDGEKEVLDKDTLNQWLCVNGDLEVILDELQVMRYVQGLGRKYDTVGIPRNFKTSLGKTVEVKGGLYGWKINRDAEVKALIENIKLGKVLEREAVYTQRSLPRGECEIGSTYVEINITRQHLWMYKDGRLVAQGSVVTGNPNRGNATAVGTYMLNYKEKGTTLTGPGYEAGVTYWMPFYGNIGIHDATWRYSFGGSIYKRNGSHGCINAPLYLAKAVYENIEAGTPIICYEE